MASNFTPLQDFTAIMARNQTAGRGQRDNSFYSKAGESLTFSFIFFPKSIPADQIFALNVLMSLGIHDWLKTIADDVHIKWPNDIILSDKKVCGVLIENKITGQKLKHSIVGIGINVHQEIFPQNIAKKATSLRIYKGEPVDYAFDWMAIDIMACIHQRHQAFLDDQDLTSLFAEYNKHLFRRGIDTVFEINGEQKLGTISHVDHTGLLHIIFAHGTTQTFSLQEVSMVYP